MTFVYSHIFGEGYNCADKPVSTLFGGTDSYIYM